jgi:apolipoprotein N-acyltransferase
VAQHRTTLSLRATIILCALSGLLLSLCFPPAGLWFLAWVALVPWLIALRLARGGAAFLGSWIGGFVFLGALCYWLYLFGVSVLVLAALALGLWLVLWAMSVRWIGRLGPAPRIVGVAVLWAGVEWVRGLGDFGFTWGWLGYSQSPRPDLLPLAGLFGTLALSFVIALVNAAVADVVLAGMRGDRPARAVLRAGVCVAVVALCMFGARAAVKRTRPTGPEIRAIVIQGSSGGPLTAKDVNIPPSAAERQKTLDIYGSLTAKAATQRPALVIWPESVIPGAPEADPDIAARVSQIARSSDAWLLAGGPYYDERGRTFNSAYLYSPTGNLTARYDKVQLVPFGEYVPARAWLPLLKRYNVRDFDFTAGAVHRVLQAGTIAVGPMICFESTFPIIGWQLADRRAQVLVVITNDAWFGRTAAAAQHQQMAVLRAVETGRWVLRGASTGISSIIAPDGRVVARAGLYKQSVLSARVRLTDGGKRFASVQPAFAWAMVALAIAYLIVPAALPRGRGTVPSARRSSAPRPRAKATPR